jgi:hypothetical protein
MEPIEQELLREIRADVKSILQAQASQSERINNSEERIDKIEPKVERLEGWRQRVLGIVTVIGAGVGFLASLAKDAIAGAFHWGS